MLYSIVIAFFVSALTVVGIRYTQRFHAHLSLDHDTSGIQKMHSQPVPRIGGLAIFVSLAMVALIETFWHHNQVHFPAALLLPSLVVFAGGLAEDLFKSLSPRVRMFIMIAAVTVAVVGTHSLPIIRHMDNIWLDSLLTIGAIAFVITCFAVVGVSNSYNIIDGYNGLSGTSAVINLLGIVYLANQVGASGVMMAALILIGAILGFLVFNYPFGKIFLGDGGAYTVGFVIALLSLNLVELHSDKISPYAVLLLAAYPIVETVFTIIRRKFIHKTKAMEPDKLHLHQLIFDRCTPHRLPLTNRNALVMPIMVMFMLPQVAIVMLGYQSSQAMLLGLLLYVVYYIYFYSRLVHFRVPRFMQVESYLSLIKH